jgi:hypothetical protein
MAELQASPAESALPLTIPESRPRSIKPICEMVE